VTADPATDPGREPLGGRVRPEDGEFGLDPDFGLDAGERTARRLRRLAALFQQAAQVVQALAKDRENPLAGSRSAGLMSSDGTNAMNANPAGQANALLSANEVARYLGICAKTVQRWRAHGKLPPAISLCGMLRWRRSDVEAWLRDLEEPR